MSPDREPLSEYLDPQMIEVYLMAHGWDVRTRNDKFSIWTHAGDGAERVHLFVPLSRRPADFDDRLEELVVQLASFEHRDLEVVTTNLRYATADLVRVRLVSPRVGAGELPIEDGRKLFEGTRDMMWAAACAAVQPRANYGPRAPAPVKDYLDGVRLGQTERGSYVVTVISDVTPPEQQALLPEEAAHLDVPFERRVTTKLVEALDATRSAAARVLTEQADVASTFEETIDRGVSANLCGAITEIAEEQVAAQVQISVNWAASRPPTLDRPSTVMFESNTLPVLEEAVNALRQLGPFEDELIEGFVIRLNRGKEEEAIGSIVIEGTAHGARRNVHVQLPDEQYHLAIRAHDERQPVRVRGTLAKRGRNWVLSDPGQLRLEEAESG
ncbi:MAG: hypothetical protein IRZ21_03155 [Thermoleophilaceae bacterium]|nr:hypothetical protein [Thermoleophilaceae bacterium]